MNLSTVDENQRKLFDGYSTVWWDRDGPLNGLHRAGEFMFKYITDVASKRGLRKDDVLLLDAGCGGGLLSEPLVRHGFHVTGVDVNPTLIQVAQTHAQLDPSLKILEYRHESIEEHADHNTEKYDVVILTFVMQHLKNHHVILKSCVTALKPGGLLILTSIAKTFMSWWNVVIVGQNWHRVPPRNSHNWHNFMSAKDVEDILKDSDCVVNETKGFHYNGWTKRWYWDNNINAGFYAMCVTKNKI